mgnify:CR=1 FL=1
MNIMTNEIIQHKPQGEIILYQPDETVRLEVRIEDETVWLNQQQMAELFGTNRQAITKHLRNIYAVEELSKQATCSILELVRREGKRMVTRKIEFYNLDAIISVGFRVNTRRGIEFRTWANKVLKDYLLRGYSFNNQILQLEHKMDVHEATIESIKTTLSDHQQKIDFFVQTSLPPKVGLFFDGQVFDAYALLSQLIRSAKSSIVLIDNYIDETVLTLLDKRESSVSATIYMQHVSQQLQLDLKRHNQQYSPIAVEYFNRSHDRFLIVDDTVYHLGASLKDMGRKWCAIMQMGIDKDIILKQL